MTYSPPGEQTDATSCREVLLDAAERLEGLARRLRRHRDFSGEWAVRSVAWDLLLHLGRVPRAHRLFRK